MTTAPITEIDRAVQAMLVRCEAAEQAQRAEAIAACFAPEGLLEEDGRTLRGRRAIQGEYDRLRQRPQVAGSPAWPHAHRRTSQREIEVVGAQEAIAITRFVLSTAGRPIGAGTIVDVLRPVTDRQGRTEWLIVHRRVRAADQAPAAPRLAARRGARRQAAADPLRPRLAGPSAVDRSRRNLAS